MSIDDVGAELVCIGCGPANLALAAAVQDARLTRGNVLGCRVLERKPVFSWHEGMRLSDADCQVSHLKDLATLRDPRSEFTFLNYLHETGRLLEFADLDRSVPSRDDFSSYFAWAARKLASSIVYRAEVALVEPVVTRGKVAAFRSRFVCDGVESELASRYLSIAIGGRPSIPDEFSRAIGRRCFHSDNFLQSLAELRIDARCPVSIAIVGGGQSAVDLATHILLKYPSAKVSIVTRGYSFRAADDNPFFNKFFSSQNAELIHGFKSQARARLAEQYYDTGVGVADMRALRRLYEIVYRDRSAGRDRFAVASYSRIIAARCDDTHVSLRRRNHVTQETEDAVYDLVVLATGYDRSLRLPCLEPIRELIFPSGAAAPELDIDYSLTSLRGHPAAAFLQGYGAYSHGVGDEALSLVATRAGVIENALSRRAGMQSVRADRAKSC